MCDDRRIVSIGIVPSAMITGIANHVATAHDTPAAGARSWPAMPKRSSRRRATPTAVERAAHATSWLRRSHAAAMADEKVGSPPSAAVHGGSDDGTEEERRDEGRDEQGERVDDDARGTAATVARHADHERGRQRPRARTPPTPTCLRRGAARSSTDRGAAVPTMPRPTASLRASSATGTSPARSPHPALGPCVGRLGRVPERLGRGNPPVSRRRGPR